MKHGLMRLFALLIAVYSLTVSNTLLAQCNIITTIAGSATSAIGDGGPATSASLSFPQGLAMDKNGNIYVADASHHRIRKITRSGVITTIAGTGSGAGGFTGDGGPATATKLNSPACIALDTFGNVYISDMGNHRIRKIDTSGIISTIAGTGTPVFSGDGGPATAAQIGYPFGLAFDAAGNLFVAASYNNRIRKITPSGIISTVAGTGAASYSGDGGPATSATFNQPINVAIDASGNLLIADYLNNRIRRVTPSGIISTIVGTGVSGFSGDGGPATAAKIWNAFGIAFDIYGNMYLSDAGNNRIRKVDASGVITSIAGTGTSGYAGDGGAATAARFNVPFGICIDSSINIYIADRGNDRVRKISSGLPSAGAIAGATELCAGTTATLIDVAAGGTWSASNVLIASVSSTGFITAISAGIDTISYTVTNSCGSSVATIPVIVHALPNPVITLSGTDTLSTSSFASYQWFRNDTTISGATSRVLVFGVSGNYTVKVTDVNGCSDTSAPITVTASGGGSGVTEVNKMPAVAIYPNPSTSLVHISADVTVNVVVVTATGRIVVEQKNATDIDLSGFADGIYMILVYDENSILLKAKKLIKVEQ